MLWLIHLDNLDFSVLRDYLVHLQLSEQRMIFENSCQQDLKSDKDWPNHQVQTFSSVSVPY